MLIRNAAKTSSSLLTGFRLISFSVVVCASQTLFPLLLTTRKTKLGSDFQIQSALRRSEAVF